jgi:hypothetical protein
LSFSPLYGFNLETDTINNIKISSATARGKIVEVNASTGTAAVGNEYGYFTLEEVTSDGPSYEERIAGLRQWEVIVDSPVALLIPKNGAIVRTSHVAVSDGSAVLSCTLVISAGVFCTEADIGTSDMRGIIVGTPTETGIDGVYDIKIVNANGRA